MVFESLIPYGIFTTIVVLRTLDFLPVLNFIHVVTMAYCEETRNIFVEIDIFEYKPRQPPQSEYKINWKKEGF